MDEELRLKARSGNLRSVDLKRAGYAIVHCSGPRVLDRLHELGWYVLAETRTTAGVDCKNWTHCGPSCCGRCPYCGDDYTKQNSREETLVSPPTRMSRRKARSALWKVMQEFVTPNRNCPQRRGPWRR